MGNKPAIISNEALQSQVARFQSLPKAEREKALEWAREAAGLNGTPGAPNAIDKQVYRELYDYFLPIHRELCGLKRQVELRLELAAMPPAPLPSFRQVIIFTAKGAAIAGGGYIAVMTITGAGAAIYAFLLANAWLPASIVGVFCAALAVSGLSTGREKDIQATDDVENETQGGAKVFVNNIHVHDVQGDVNVVIKNEQ